MVSEPFSSSLRSLFLVPAEKQLDGVVDEEVVHVVDRQRPEAVDRGVSPFGKVTVYRLALFKRSP